MKNTTRVFGNIHNGYEQVKIYARKIVKTLKFTNDTSDKL